LRRLGYKTGRTLLEDRKEEQPMKRIAAIALLLALVAGLAAPAYAYSLLGGSRPFKPNALYYLLWI